MSLNQIEFDNENNKFNIKSKTINDEKYDQCSDDDEEDEDEEDFDYEDEGNLIIQRIKSYNEKIKYDIESGINLIFCNCC
jgi:hypothetical protein